jgi:outer membrane protein OmpA-like peptidoglycan-associated protein
MRRFALVILVVFGATAPVAAQIQPDVTVNPNASGTRVLLYPGGQYGRVVRPLLQPGERDPNAPILLHMPRKHRAVAAAKPKPKKVETAAAAPAPAPAPQSDQQTVPLSALPDESAARLVTEEAAKPAPAKPKPAPPKQASAPKPPPPKQVASAKPPPPKQAPAPKPQPAQSSDQTFGLLSGHSDEPPAPATKPAPAPAPPPARVASVEPTVMELSKRNSILFSPGAEEPPASALDTVRAMTSSLTAALWSGTAHVQLEAFGGKQNDKSSEARRLSLKRALIIRQLLIDDGIPSERIVVRAMGGASDGAPDRVDIFVAA